MGLEQRAATRFARLQRLEVIKDNIPFTFARFSRAFGMRQSATNDDQSSAVIVARPTVPC